MNKNTVPGEYCANCNSPMDENDKYCSICGAERGTKPYAPEDMDIQCVYGPPPMAKTRIHRFDSGNLR